MKPLHSAITTTLAAQPSKTGTQLGAHGSETPESSRLVAWLASRQPEDVDRAAVSQASRRGVTLDVLRDLRFDRDEHGNSTGSYVVPRSVTATGTPEQRAAAKADILRLMAPAPEASVEAWLAELSVIVARRQDDEFTEGLRLTAYASRLRKYPADIARKALLGHPWKFWPSWAELEWVCEREVAIRRAMVAALDRDHRQPEERRERVTAERAAEIMREAFGARPDTN